MRAWNYTRMCIAAIAIAALVLCMPGCNSPAAGKAHGRRAVTALLDSAETMMNQAPEQAYRLLDSIDSRSLRSRALNARYALLFTEAQYKCYIQAPGDSLIMTAVKYYSVGNHPEQLFRSFYCLGCIYNESGRLVDAAVALEQAEQLSDKIDDGYRKGLLYTQLGDVFFNSYDFHRAKHYYRSAMDNYAAAGKESHRMYALHDVGGCLMQLNKYDEAHSIMTEVNKWSIENNDNYLCSASLSNQLLCSIRLDDSVSVNSEFIRYNDCFGIPENNINMISLFAKYYTYSGNTSQARIYLDKGWSKSSAKPDSIIMWLDESLFEERTGKMDSALIKYKHSIQLQNQNLHKMLNQPILGAQKDYYKNLAETESLKASRTLRTITLLSICFLLMIVSFFQIIRSNRLKFESDKKDLMLTIKELRLKENSNNEIINNLSNQVNSLFSRPYEELDNIYEKMIETDDLIEVQTSVQDANKKEAYYNKKVDEFYKHVKEKFDEIISDGNQKELDLIINSTCGNIMTRLQDEKLNLTKQDLLILRLSIVGFSPKTISRLTNTQFKTVHQQRRRAILKINNYSEKLAQEIVKILGMN